MVVQIIAALVGSVGFAIFFKMKGKQIALAGIGGAVTWMVYLFVQSFVTGYFVPYFAAAVFVAVYAEIMARINRAPATIFLTAAAVPLIPGGSLYYTMAGLVNKDEVLFTQSGEAAIVIALAIAMGFVVVAVITRYIRAFLNR
ncbi:MAG: threonine/serine exporter family protein [Candidatus Fimisoma sp.]|nr:threonine/serine exporter family protein [Bacillota bacterium]MDY4748583.1 threonine/serine exporter family protein [Candidatus Fimisoma sp.]